MKRLEIRNIVALRREIEKAIHVHYGREEPFIIY